MSGGEVVGDFHLCTDHQPLYPNGILNLRKAIKEYRPVLVTVDSYTTVRTPRTQKTDFVKAEYNDMRLLSELACETGVSINLIHHQSKTRQTDPFESIAGSYAMGAGVDGRMIVEKLDGAERLVRVDGRDLDAFEFVYARGADRRLFHVIDGPAAVHWERMRLIANRQNGSFNTKEAGETFGLTDRQGRRIITQWEQISAVVEVERGRYTFEAHVLEAAMRLKSAIEA